MRFRISFVTADEQGATRLVQDMRATGQLVAMPMDGPDIDLTVEQIDMIATTA